MEGTGRWGRVVWGGRRRRRKKVWNIGRIKIPLPCQLPAEMPRLNILHRFLITADSWHCLSIPHSCPAASLLLLRLPSSSIPRPCPCHVASRRRRRRRTRTCVRASVHMRVRVSHQCLMWRRWLPIRALHCFDLRYFFPVKLNVKLTEKKQRVFLLFIFFFWVASKPYANLSSCNRKQWGSFLMLKCLCSSFRVVLDIKQGLLYNGNVLAGPETSESPIWAKLFAQIVRMPWQTCSSQDCTNQDEIKSRPRHLDGTETSLSNKVSLSHFVGLLLLCQLL